MCNLEFNKEEYKGLVDGFLSYYVDAPHSYSWWQNADSDYQYLYVSDQQKYKYGCTDGRNVVMKYDARVQIYAVLVKKSLKEDNYGFKQGTTYLEIIEFGCQNSLIADRHFSDYNAYLNNFARHESAQFILYKKTEKSFTDFYDKMSWSTDLIQDDCGIICVE